MSEPIQTFVGVKLSMLFAGAAGAVVAALTGGGPWWQRWIRVVVGFLSSIYLTPVVVVYAADLTRVQGEALEHAAAFLCGYIGMGLLDALAGNIRRRLRPPPMPSPPGLGDEGAA